MANQFGRKKNRKVDNEIYASQQLVNSGYRMPPIMQEYVIEPKFIFSDTPTQMANGANKNARQNTTRSDYQPAKEDKTNKWKRQRRALNIVTGALALIASLIVLLPYVLGFFGTSATRPIVLSFSTFNSIRALWDGVPKVFSLGLLTPESNTVLVSLVSHVILAIGILAVAINTIKSICALLFVKKPVKYLKGACVNLICALIILIISLVGAPYIDVVKVDFMTDIIKGYASSELFTLLAFALAYTIVCIICSLINRDKYGYLK